MDGPSQVLVFDSGPSWIRYQLFETRSRTRLAAGLVERIAEAGHGRITHRAASGVPMSQPYEIEERFPDHAAGLAAVLTAFERAGPELAAANLAAVGHKVAHGGDRFSGPAVIDDAVTEAIRELSQLAPLHNPANLGLIEAARRTFPDVPHVAVFDTAFHQTLPQHAYTHVVPTESSPGRGVRRYGFHGTSHRYVTRRTAELLARPPDLVNLIVLHLGDSASATAVAAGRSIDTSDVHDLLNAESGLTALAGSDDMRDVLSAAEAGDDRARLAVDVYCYRIRKCVGAYYAVLGHVDAVVFTGSVGEHSAAVRHQALSGLERLGISVDPARNAETATAERYVSPYWSEVAVLVVPTDEGVEIADEALSSVPRL